MRGSLSASERHDRKRAEHKRYYAQTAFKYERREWTDDEDKLVLIQRIPDEVHLEPPLAFAQGGI